MNFLARVSFYQERLAMPLIAVPFVVYVITWNWNPYGYGFSVLILGAVQIAFGAAGLAFMAMGLSRKAKGISVLMNILLIASALAAFVALKSIHWA